MAMPDYWKVEIRKGGGFIDAAHVLAQIERLWRAGPGGFRVAGLTAWGRLRGNRFVFRPAVTRSNSSRSCGGGADSFTDNGVWKMAIEIVAGLTGHAPITGGVA